MLRRTYKKKVQRGGSKKYILLSCPEFNETVDRIMSEDTNIMLHGKPTTKSIAEYNADESLINPEEFAQFVEESGIDNKRLFLRDINTFESDRFYRGFINWKTYNDKTPDIKMNAQTVTRLRGAKVIFLAYFSFNEPLSTSMIDQLLFLNALNHYGVAEINIVLPYFPVGTMERIVGEGEIPTAYSLAHMLNSIPEGTTKNNLYIFDIHALCSRFFFHTNTRPILVTMMTEYLKFIDTEYPESENNHNIIVFPDDGAKKRFDKLLPPKTKKIVCGKTRQGEQRIIKIESGLEYVEAGLNKKMNMFVIDDLVQSGGTLLNTFDGLRNELVKLPGYQEANIKYVSIVTHSVFPTDKNLENFFKDRGPTAAKIHSLITTNSRPLRTEEMKKTYGNRVKVLDISTGLAKIFIDIRDTNYITPYSLH